ncbi:MAG: DUF3365 domain-containing protein [Gallionella sp.]|nr:DUF3365 domain-containing protein [Gallionella sp.]
MSPQTDTPDAPPVFWLRRYGLLAFVWSILTGGSLLWNLHQEDDSIVETATVVTRANIQKDIGFRRWLNSHGGVYVSPTERTPPNPYLNVPDRDVVTTTGKRLTLMNPAYVLREMQTYFSDDYATRSHITSLNPLNPANVPDEWEVKALKSFERGGKELVEVQEIGGRPYLRLMEPFIVEQGCLKCHAHQGYKIGDVRGGIGSSVPLDRFFAHRQEHSGIIMLFHGTVWLIGLAALGISYRRDHRRATERQQSRKKLQQQLDELLRFQKLTVGRELRMQELVKENTALRLQIAAAQPGVTKS